MSKMLSLTGGNLALGALLIALALPGLAYTDEATLLDGKPIHGKLILKESRLSFVPSRRSPLQLDQVHHVRFFSTKRIHSSCATLFHLTLIDGQRVTGELLGMDEDSVRFRPTWAGTLTIPRRMVVSILQVPGFLTYLDEDFEKELQGWKLTGQAVLSGRQHASGKRSLCVNAAGQIAEYTLAKALEAGRAGINFHDPLHTAGRLWLLEAQFQGAAENGARKGVRPPKFKGSDPFSGPVFGKGPHLVRVILAGPSDSYRLEMPQGKQPAFSVRRRAGWHRLRLDFTSKLLLITIDDDLLWVSREQGPGGPLRAIRLMCKAVPSKAKPDGDAYFDDFALARTVEPLRHRPADPHQDELWLVPGDQVLGRMVRADRRTIEFSARFGKRTWNWGEVRGIFFRRVACPPRIIDGEQIDVRLRTGAGPEADAIVGQVRGLDGRQLSLRNPILGDLTIDRDHVRRLRWVAYGRRIELDQTEHHLGPKGKLVAGLHPPRAEGLSLTWKFDVDALPATAQLHVQVVHLKGRDDSLAKAWERGELRTEVVLNGQVIDYLNRHAPDFSLKPRRLTMPLPRKVLRVGANTLQLRQTPERKTKHYENCGVSNLVIEMPIHSPHQ